MFVNSTYMNELHNMLVIPANDITYFHSLLLG